MYFLLPSLFFSSLLLALTHAILPNCPNPQSHLLGLLFSLGLHIFTPSSLAEWPLYFFHLFLLFFLSHSSHQVTINASQLILTLLQPVSFLQPSLCRMTLAFCFFLFVLPSNVSHKFHITYLHPFINVVGLLYIIIEEKMNPILLFRTSYFSKPISLC